MCDAEIGVEKLAAFALNQIRFSVLRKNATSEHSHSYLVVIQILQRFFASALPDLHLPRLGDVGLPVDDSPLTPAPARRQRVQVERLVVRGAVHRAEHAAEFLPRPGGAVGAHALEEGWHFPGGRHAFSGWSLVGGGKPGVQLLLLIVSACAAAAFRSSGGRTTAQKESSRMLQKNSHSVIYLIIWAQPIVSPASRKQFGIAYS